MTTRVLIVCDGDRFSFAGVQPNEQFTISFLVGALKSNPAFQVKTEYRKPADPLGAPLDFPAFNFAATDLTQFDVLWLIGDEGLGSTDGGSPIGDDELLAIAHFMDGGGGVFATGDHESIGSQMCGRIPRLRTMRNWYWDVSAIPADVPPGGQANWTVLGPQRADTLQPSVGGGFFFDSQSDRVPQPLQVHDSTHPILQVPSGVLNRYPDHMHEGMTVVPWTTSATYSFLGSAPRPEYPALPAQPLEAPKLLATGTVIPGHTTVNSPNFTGPSGGNDNSDTAVHPPIGILCTYDGWKAGVGRVVTDGSFHHLLDINLIGDPEGGDLGGGNSAETHAGFNGTPGMLADMSAFFNNTVAWLARPVRTLTLVIDKSTYGKDEAQAHPMGRFDSALYVIVDGLAPADFPGGPLDELIDPAAPTAAQLAKLANWAPHIPTPAGGAGITFTAIGVSSDDATLPARVQRFTFVYRATFTDLTVFNFAGGAKVLTIAAALGVSPAPAPAMAQIELITDADPYFSNYANGNTVGYLSSDLRVFKVIEGEAPFGFVLGHTAADARIFIQNAMASMTPSQFDALPTDENTSALSLTTQTTDGKSIFNFALARVRLNGVSLPANPARVFFRVFQAPTTAALTYQTDGSGNPTLGYAQFATGGTGGRKVPLVGISADGSEYLSLPCFAAVRATNTATGNNMTTQHDDLNAKNLVPGGGEKQFFYGAWLDTNQTTGYFPATPVGQAHRDGPYSGPLQPILTALLAGVHQCLGAEIVFDGAPIPNNSNPGNSDKLAQRNIAYTTVANPGTPSSRTATHTFEVRPSPVGLDGTHRPDELMIDWRNVPRGATAALYLPAVAAADVVALAGKMYATHGLAALDAHTLQVPVGGITYVPLPTAGLANFAGLFTLDLPAGIVKGQRFDVALRQITTAGLQAVAAAALTAKAADAPSGRSHEARKARAEIFEARLGAKSAAPRADWRKVYGGFQIAIPVSTKADMLVPEARILSILRWRAAALSANSRWYPVFKRYLDVLAARFEGLGGDPASVPPTPDGTWPGLTLIGGAGKTPAYPTGHGEPASQDGHPLHELERLAVTGKIDALVFNHFGDFEAFVIETEAGEFHRYDSSEPRVLAIVRRAWEERITVAVHASRHQPHRPLEIVLLRGGAP